MLQHASVLCRRHKPAAEIRVDNTAKLYGRRNRSWHYEPQAQASC
jgi:hypothetical protein